MPWRVERMPTLARLSAIAHDACDMDRVADQRDPLLRRPRRTVPDRGARSHRRTDRNRDCAGPAARHHRFHPTNAPAPTTIAGATTPLTTRKARPTVMPGSTRWMHRKCSGHRANWLTLPANGPRLARGGKAKGDVDESWPGPTARCGSPIRAAARSGASLRCRRASRPRSARSRPVAAVRWWVVSLPINGSPITGYTIRPYLAGVQPRSRAARSPDRLRPGRSTGCRTGSRTNSPRRAERGGTGPASAKTSPIIVGSPGRPTSVAVQKVAAGLVAGHVRQGAGQRRGQ